MSPLRRRSAAIIRGAWGFGLTGVIAFSLWAFQSAWLPKGGGELLLYSAIASAFLGLSGLLLHPLISGPHSLLNFYLRFVPAFALYSVVWSAAWFIWGFGFGEVACALAGSLAFVAVLGRLEKGWRPLLAASGFLFIVHFVTYWLGGQLAYRLLGPHGSDWLPGVDASTRGLIAKLLWGLFYGVGFGAGLGNALSTYRTGPTPPR
jgi:hypothetical protein